MKSVASHKRLEISRSTSAERSDHRLPFMAGAGAQIDVAAGPSLWRLKTYSPVLGPSIHVQETDCYVRRFSFHFCEIALS
jgi:hypothetical protein